MLPLLTLSVNSDVGRFVPGEIETEEVEVTGADQTTDNFLRRIGIRRPAWGSADPWVQCSRYGLACICSFLFVGFVALFVYLLRETTPTLTSANLTAH